LVAFATVAMNDKVSFQRAYGAALRLISYRPKSVSEIRLGLRRRFPETLVDQVVQRLIDQGLLDDTGFAQQWSRSRDTHRPRSKQRVKEELLSKGVDRVIAENAVLEIDDESNAYRAALKQTSKFIGLKRPVFQRRTAGFLQRRGFAPSVIRRTVDKLWEQRAETGDD